MRFSWLDLDRYGGFEGRVLSFEKRASAPDNPLNNPLSKSRDLQIIYGPNEAGKSTTRRAVLDFLFGFPFATEGADWKTAAQNLRLGAEIETKDGVLTGWRKRSNPRTRLYESDMKTLLDDALLKRALGDLDKTAYDAAWALDHRRLREGGKELAAFKEDAGLQFLAADLDPGTLGRLMKTLAKEKDDLWRKRASTTEIAKKKKELETRKESLAEKLVSPEGLLKARADERAAADDISRLDAELSDLRRQQRKLERLGGVLAPYWRYRAASAAFDERAPVLFSATEAEALLASEAALRTLDARLDGLENALTALDKERASLGPRPPLLDDAPLLAALRAKQAEREEKDAALQTLRRDLQENRQKRATLERRLGLSSGASLPDLEGIERLRAHQETFFRLRTQLDDAQEALETATQALAQTPAPGPWPKTTLMNALRAWRDEARALLPAVETLADAQDASRAEKAALEQALAKLSPWKPGKDAAGESLEETLTALHALRLPTEEEERDVQHQKTQLREGLRRESADLRQAKEKIEELLLSQAQLQETGQGVSVEQITQARRERDALLDRSLSRSLSGTLQDKNEERLLRDLIEKADRLADRRVNEAHSSSKLEQIAHDLQKARLDACHAEARVQAEENALLTQQINWLARLERANLPALPIVEFPAWRLARTQALTLAETHRAHEKETQRQKGRLASHYASLAKFLPMCPLLPGSEVSFFQEALKNTAQTLDALEEEQKNWNKREQVYDSAASILEEARAKKAALERSWQRERTSWAEACARESAPASLTPEDFPLLQKLVHLDAALARDEKTHARLETERNEFITTEKALLARHKAASLENLASLLETANQTEAERQTLAGRRRTLSEQIASEKQTRALWEQSRQVFTTRAEEAQLDKGALESKARTDLETAAARTKRDDARNALLEAGQGETLEKLCEEAAALEPDTLEAEKARLEALLERLNEEQKEAIRRHNDARQTLKTLETQDDAVGLEAEIAQIEAELSELAEAYVSVHLQQSLLATLVTRERQKAHGPLLERAGVYFSRLTLGDYTGLHLEEQENALALTGVRAGSGASALVPTDAMSEGAQDQLYLALRLARTSQALDAGLALPFLADDLFITFDDARSRAGLDLLAEFSERTQILFFTHHARLREMGAEVGRVIDL